MNRLRKVIPRSVATLLIVFAALAPALIGGVASATTTNVSASDDTFVWQDNPDTTYGTVARWSTDGRSTTPRKALLKFNVPAPTAGTQVTGLTLHAFSDTAGDSNGPGPVIYKTTNDWAENTATWNNKPAAGTQLATTAAPYAQTSWVQWDVSGALDTTTQTSGGTVSFLVDTSEAKWLGFRSKETTDTTQAPYLEVATTAAPSDTAAPTAPVLSGSTATPSTVKVNWTAATDNVGVTGYDVYVRGVKVGTVDASTLTYTATGLASSTQYKFEVSAFDAAGNHSAMSNAVYKSTTADTVAPSAPTLSAGTTTSSSIDLSWTAATDNVGVTAYNVYVNDVLTHTLSGTTLSDTVSGLSASTSYALKVSAVDAASNATSSNVVTQSTTAAVTDTTAPTAPVLSGSTATSSTVKVNWTASTDNVGVTGYDVYVRGVKVGTVSGSTLTYTATGLAPSTQYKFEVNAFDAAGNHSVMSNAVYKSTTAGSSDTTAPSAPTLTGGTATTSSVDLSWTAATDNVGVTGYNVYVNDVLTHSLSGTTLTDTATGLTANTQYKFTVKAVDAAGNATASNDVFKSTLPAQADPVIWAVGDLCDATHECGNVADLIKADSTTSAVIDAGDMAYEDGTTADFDNFNTYFGSRQFSDGRTIKSVTLPTPGNHEYRQTNAAPYYTYFGSTVAGTYDATNWYAKDYGNWRIISVNSNYASEPGAGDTLVNGGVTSTKYTYGLTPAQRTAQKTFLASQIDDAEANGKGVIVFDHHPAFSDGSYSPGTKIGRDLFKVAADHGAELFLSGHSHQFYRFNPVDGAGASSTKGTTQMVVGTGGREFDAKVGNASVASFAQWGATRFTLTSTGAQFQFKNESGTVLDSGTVPITAVQPTGDTVNVTASADSYVDNATANVDTNYGTASNLLTDGSPSLMTSYMKFDLSAYAGRTILGARLKVHTTTSSTSGSPSYQIVRLGGSSTWTETGLTYNNRPTVGSAIGSISDTSSNTAYAITLAQGSLTSSLGGNVTVALDETASDGLDLTSRETATPPVLELTLAP
jgi:chitodextrinase